MAPGAAEDTRSTIITDFLNRVWDGVSFLLSAGRQEVESVDAEGLARISGYVGQGRSYPTWVHAARGIAEALHHAYQGEVDLQYTTDDVVLRATWTR